MKLCYLASATSVHTAKWANHFDNQGHEVHVISFEPPQDIGSNVRVHEVGRRWPMKMHYFSNGATVRGLVETIKPQILHAHYASGYATLGRLARFHPYVVSVWGTDVFDFGKKSPIHREIIRANLKSADRVCSTSRVMADEIRAYCDVRVSVTPFGVNCEQFRPLQKHSARAEEFVVGIVKTLEPPYGIEYLIRGFAIASRKNGSHREMRLVIAGDGSLRESLESLTRELGIEQDTKFLGFVQHDRVPQILNQLSVFVAPSTGPESFGVAVVEASASGLPVIVSRIGGLPEVVQDRVTGLLVPPRDANAIAAALEELLHNESLCVDLGTNGRNFVLENYEWSENASRMQRVYDSLLNGN